MKKVLLVLGLFGFAAGNLAAQPQDNYDYYAFNREIIQRGVQAILQCNGLFTSNRSLEQVFDQELAYLNQPIGTAKGGDYQVDWERKTVAIGSPGTAPVMRAVYREGLGCIILAPDQTFEDIPQLPRLDLDPLPGDPANIPWPNGDKITPEPLPSHIDAEALQAASDWAFNRSNPEQVTLSLIVLHKGRIIHERYAPGFDVYTKTRTWSTAKSIAVTLIGILADQGKLQLDQPLNNFEWGPKAPSKIHATRSPSDMS